MVAVAKVAAAGAVLFVLRLEDAEAIGRRQLGVPLVIVKPRHILAEDRVLDRAIGGSKRLEAEFLPHVVGNLEPAQTLDLPLRRTGPYGIGAPDHVVGAEPLDQRAHQRRGKPRLRHRRPREELAEIAVDIGDAIFRGNLGELADPRDPAGLVPLRHGFGGRAADMSVGGMVDDEIELRPILCRLADIAHIGIGGEVGKLPFDGGREQPLVDANILDARLHEPLVSGVHQLLVVEVPRIVAAFLVGVVADRVALP